MGRRGRRGLPRKRPNKGTKGRQSEEPRDLPLQTGYGKDGYRRSYRSPQAYRCGAPAWLKTESKYDEERKQE